MNKKIKIGFADFWKGFNPNENWFVLFLDKYFNVEVSDSPDFLIYSSYSHSYLNFDGYRIFYTAENVRPNLLECDYALSFDYLKHPRHYRLPLYGIWYTLDANQLLLPKPPFDEVLKSKSEFCCMVVSAKGDPKRLKFYEKLSKYKQVHSGGRLLNNIGGPVIDKMEFLKKYKFTLAFENSSFPGYTTEKIFQPMFTNTIPIYWGNPLVSRDFNTKSFINWNDYRSDEAVIEKIIELDQDNNLYGQVLQEPWFNNNELNKFIKEENIKEFFKIILDNKRIPIAQTWKKTPAIFQRKYYSLIRKLK
jgi:hypothetical protein